MFKKTYFKSLTKDQFIPTYSNTTSTKCLEELLICTPLMSYTEISSQKMS